MEQTLLIPTIQEDKLIVKTKIEITIDEEGEKGLEMYLILNRVIGEFYFPHPTFIIKYSTSEFIVELLKVKKQLSELLEFAIGNNDSIKSCDFFGNIFLRTATEGLVFCDRPSTQEYIYLCRCACWRISLQEIELMLQDVSDCISELSP